jgi:tripartite-type tricarboxylate transporter receptor subunit TctC
MLRPQVATFLCALLFLSCPVSSEALAQTYPSRPITLIVPFPPGGSSDIVARTLASAVSTEFGQNIVVENRPGAGGSIGVGVVAKAAPDGYTIGLAAAGALTVDIYLRAMTFDPQKDLAPITLLAAIPFVLVGSLDAPKSVAEVIALAKAEPGKLSMGHAGNGTAQHLSAALFTQQAGVRIPVVAYRGSAPAANDVLGGHVPLAVVDIPSCLELIRSGKLRALGVTSTARLASLPDAPTLAEAGLPGYDAVGWFGLVAPGATPPDIVARLNAAFVKAMQNPALATQFRSLGVELSPTTSEGFRQFIRSESAKWAKVIAEAGIKAD